jgi:hypothetical protein
MTKQIKKTSAKTRTTALKSTDRAPSTLDDFKSALLMVSLTINAFILVGWIALQVTTQYDLQVATLLFVR